jgi:hypothetical protein
LLKFEIESYARQLFIVILLFDLTKLSQLLIARSLNADSNKKKDSRKFLFLSKEEMDENKITYLFKLIEKIGKNELA